MVARIRQKLAILIENRVGPQAGLKDISACLGDLIELGAEIETALECDVDSRIESETILGSIVLSPGRNFERPVELPRGRRDGFGLRRRDRGLERGWADRRGRTCDRGWNALGSGRSRASPKESAGSGQIAEDCSPCAG